MTDHNPLGEWAELGYHHSNRRSTGERVFP